MFPRGWYVVGSVSDVAAGEVKTVHYFGQDIVLFRTESGVLSAVDRTCPHLGAHLGVGHVKGECLRCPFHDWAFAPDGRCVEVPYAPKIPPKAQVKTWPMRERNGLIFVYYCPRGEAPTWEIPEIDLEGWTPNRVVRWEVRSHPQEVAENTVDCSHLRPVHHVISTEVVSVAMDAHVMHVVLNMVATGAPIEMPDEINDVELDVTLHGLGQIISRTHVKTSDLRTMQRIHSTPIDDENIAIFGVGNTKEMKDPGYTREIDDVFWQAFNVDFPKDFPIWSTKAYIERPLLVPGDGPIGRYRRWCRQFYDVPAEAAAPRAEAAAPRPAIVRLTQWIKRLAAGPQAPAAGEQEVDEHLAGERRPPAPKAAPAAPQQRFPSVSAYFESLESRFDPKAAGDLDAVFQWVLTGGDARADSPRAYFARIKGGSIQAAAGTHEAPTVTIEMSAEDYLLMINGELNGARAFSTGRGRLRGPVRLAMKMQKLFPLDRAV